MTAQLAEQEELKPLTKEQLDVQTKSPLLRWLQKGARGLEHWEQQEYLSETDSEQGHIIAAETQQQQSGGEVFHVRIPPQRMAALRGQPVREDGDGQRPDHPFGRRHRYHYRRRGQGYAGHHDPAGLGAAFPTSGP